MPKSDNPATPWALGLKKTRQRQLVWEALENAEAPVTVPDISARLERLGTPVWLSTIYRILDQFVERGLLLKIIVTENGQAMYEINDHNHRHYAVCLACNKIIPLEHCPVESFRPQLEGESFQITGHRLQMYGFCKGCHPPDKPET